MIFICLAKFTHVNVEVSARKTFACNYHEITRLTALQLKSNGPTSYDICNGAVS
jgi:hypothetical protein